MTKYNLWNEHGLIQNSIPERKVARMVSLDLIDIAAAIEAEGWCGAQDIHGPVIIVAEDNDASDLPSEAWEHISGEDR